MPTKHSSQHTPISVGLSVYTNFHTFGKNSTCGIRLSDGNSNSVATNRICFQIHKSPSVLHYDWGFCCCSGQLASEELRQQCATSKQTLCRVECSTPWRSRLLRHTFLDEIRSGLSPYGEAECALSAVSRHKAKSRQRAGSRSGKYHLRPGPKS